MKRTFKHKIGFLDTTAEVQWIKGKGTFAISKSGNITKLKTYSLKVCLDHVKAGAWIEIV